MSRSLVKIESLSDILQFWIYISGLWHFSHCEKIQIQMVKFLLPFEAQDGSFLNNSGENQVLHKLVDFMQL